MKLTRCNQGHFFDADKYTSCPHCNSAVAQDKTLASEPPKMPTTPPPQKPAPVKKAEPSLKSQVDDVQKTVGMFSVDKSAKQPVAGWLVCVEGAHLGEDFRIVMGRNFLGRAGNMDIILAKDNMVSRDKHAIIVYEPKGNLFIIQAGESKELFYLNDKVVLSPTELKAYDVIKIGASKLLFVPFCSASFNWNDIKSDEETAQ